MKIATWNINGLRASLRNDSFYSFLKEELPDIVCLQETKCQISEIDTNSSQYFVEIVSCETKKGYSGVGLYYKEKPESILYGIKNKEYDKEARSITMFYSNFILINTYFPNGGDRKGFENGGGLVYKLGFYQAFLGYIDFLKDVYRKPLILTGDFNITHTEKDLARAKENKNSIGCLPQERSFLDDLIKKGYIDIWRMRNPDTIQYTWWDQISRARERNVGWRIDYFFVSQELIEKVETISILDQVKGSDHCPITLSLKIV